MTATMERLRQAQHETVNDLAAEILRLQETKRDYVVDTRRMTFRTYSVGTRLDWDVPTAEALTDDAETPGTDGGFLREHAHRQIGERLGIPRKYYDRMRGSARTLLDENVQHWLLMQPERRLVRMVEGQVRAFLSDRYRRLDNVDLMTHAVLPIFQRHEGLVFQTAALTDERLYVRALLPGLEREVTVGDVVQAGVEIRNSEVGKGALSVGPFVMRLVCRNGMVVQDRALSRYHVGRAQDEDAYAIYRDDTLAADDAAFFLKVRDAVEAAFSEVTFDLIVADMRAAATGTPIQNPVAATERLTQRFDLGENEAESLLRHLAVGGDMSRWGAANALTATAKQADTFERQHELEAAGGVLVALTDREWQPLAA